MAVDPHVERNTFILGRFQFQFEFHLLNVAYMTFPSPNFDLVGFAGST